jgi:hypothetical protein
VKLYVKFMETSSRSDDIENMGRMQP